MQQKMSLYMTNYTRLEKYNQFIVFIFTSNIINTILSEENTCAAVMPEGEKIGGDSSNRWG